jgi:hypothetical protein
MNIERRVRVAFRLAALPAALLAASCEPAQIDGAADDATRSYESACPSHRLWVAQDSAVAVSSTTAYWDCLLGHSNFGALASGYSTGRALSLGGVATLRSACGVVHSGGSVGSDSATLQCIVNQTGWNVGPDDVILYYPHGYGCQDGRNHWHIPVTTHGSTVNVEAAFVFSSNSSSCQEALGSHEVYEASAEASAADCCNGQGWTGCGPNPAPYGWYSFNACGGTWWAQAVSPAGHEFNGAYCTRLSFSGATCSGTPPPARPKPGTVQGLGKCMDVNGSHTADGTHVQLWDCNGTGAQSFSLGFNGRGTEILTSFNTCVDVNGGNPALGTKVQEWSCNGTPAQVWSFDSVSLLSTVGKCLDVPNANWVAGQAVQLWDCNGTAAQKFSYDPNTGYLSGANGLCLTVSGADANGTAIDLQPCGNNPSQEWRPSGGAFHSALDTNRCLDVNGASTANGTKIQLWDCNGTVAQQWGLHGPIHGVGGDCLDIPSSNTANGNQLQVWSCNGTGAQNWTFWLN